MGWHECRLIHHNLGRPPGKIPYSYTLTPQGLEEKAKITLKFLKGKLSEYETIKAQIKEIAKEIEKDETIEFPETDTFEQLTEIT